MAISSFYSLSSLSNSFVHSWHLLSTFMAIRFKIHWCIRSYFFFLFVKFTRQFIRAFVAISSIYSLSSLSNSFVYSWHFLSTFVSISFKHLWRNPPPKNLSLPPKQIKIYVPFSYLRRAPHCSCKY